MEETVDTRMIRLPASSGRRGAAFLSGRFEDASQTLSERRLLMLEGITFASWSFTMKLFSQFVAVATLLPIGSLAAMAGIFRVMFPTHTHLSIERRWFQ
jgi:hypothetical protein